MGVEKGAAFVAQACLFRVFNQQDTSRPVSHSVFYFTLGIEEETLEQHVPLPLGLSLCRVRGRCLYPRI